jgi:hypothetical protein
MFVNDKACREGRYASFDARDVSREREREKELDYSHLAVNTNQGLAHKATSGLEANVKHGHRITLVIDCRYDAKTCHTLLHCTLDVPAMPSVIVLAGDQQLLFVLVCQIRVHLQSIPCCS